MARNIHLRDCSAVACDVGPAIVQDSIVENLVVDDLLIFWGALFRHVRLSGRVGAIKTNTLAHHDIASDVQALFDAERLAFYESVDWALDISEARFAVLDIRGIPARLIRRDPSRQFVITRDRAMQPGLRTGLSDLAKRWIFAIDLFLLEGEDDCVLTVPDVGTRRRQGELLQGLLELRDVGLAEPD